jgi:hypothetical protein
MSGGSAARQHVLRVFFAPQIQVHAKFNKKRKQGDQYSDFNVAGSCSKWQLKESVGYL